MLLGEEYKKVFMLLIDLRERMHKLLRVSHLPTFTTCGDQ
jgi:hypothetical protein